ncbi:MAG: phosphatidylserine/phosphatidylglycerophosphate/cardiolipin synthase family protein [Gemmatimonadetes bacterium]|nr:phosphatidylserine/phosphatidylglycerophosphate/cardiolipin synthase family protein [Gemmatimonadota bacterium]
MRDRPRVTILVDSPAIWRAIRADLASARDCVYIQTYSFEGDQVGEQLAKELLAARAPDIRLLIDSYTRANHNDRWLAAPHNLFDRALRDEVRSTRRLVRTLSAAGIGVRFGRPLGLLGGRILRRDHKKLVLFDDRVAYVGGLNFSEHNFAWHDLMVRIEHAEVTRFLKGDFLHSWEGRSQASSRSFPELELELHNLPGKGNHELYGGLLGIIDRAEHSIHMIGPYVSPPFTGHLTAAADRGVEVHFVTPRDNNKAYLQRHLLAEAARSPVHLWLYGDGMIHMKCMLIDDRALITGSSNFDLMSYHGFLAEVVAVFRSAAVISSFRRQVLEPDLAASQRLSVTERHPIGAWGRTIARAKIRAATLVARTLSPATTREPHGR